MNYFKHRRMSLWYALSGLFQAFRKERNLQLQGLAAILVIIAGCYFKVGSVAWMVLGACITLVISLELINSSIEKLCDLYTTEKDSRIKYIKDVAAAGVLVACIFSAVVGFLIFFPYVSALFSSN